jgi:uncharacterized protein (TIGR02996 family)
VTEASDALTPAFVVTEPVAPSGPPVFSTFNPPPIPAPRHETTLTAPTPTSEVEAGFLAALRDDPDDAQTRLVYADWLEENGKLTRSNILRLELKLHALPPTSVRVEQQPRCVTTVRPSPQSLQ